MPPLCPQLRQELQVIQSQIALFDAEMEKLPKTKNTAPVLELRKEIQEKIQTLKEKLHLTPEQAQEILGQDYLGPKAIETAFNLKIKPESIPPIPFKKEELERAKELGQFLILRADKAPDGIPLTMEKMNELLKGKTKDGKKALYSGDGTGKFQDDCWYKDEPFATEETPKLSWALVSKEIIPGSISQNYLQQTETIIDYLKNQVFKGKPLSKEYQAAIKEFESKKEEITALIASDWEKAAEELSQLKINSLTRQTPVEALYDAMVYFQNNGERLLESKYTWTARRASGGELVDVGPFDAGGVSVDRHKADSSGGSLGASFSRRI